MGKHGKNEYSVQCVEHAFDLLELYHDNHAELGVSALSRMTKLPKSKIFRLLTTLTAWNYIEQNQLTENYRLGPRTLELRQSFVRHMKRSGFVRSLLESIAAACNETVCYTVLDKGNVLTLDKIDSHQVYRASPQVGALLPAYCTAAGKAMLAQLDHELLDDYCSAQLFKQYTPQTITDISRLRRELGEVTRQGYAVARDEMEAEMSSVACVVRDHTLRCVGAVALVCPSVRLTEERLTGQIVPLLLDITAGISGRLGYWSDDHRAIAGVSHNSTQKCLTRNR